MDKRIRTTLLFLALLLFIVAAPIVVLYAIGYRFVATGNPTVPVGVLFVESAPRGARMYVDGKLEGTTPQAVTSLPEGQVHVRLEKDGYDSWEKTVDVHPTKTTEFRAVKLFANAQTPTTLEKDIDTFSLSPNRKLVASVSGNKLHFLDTKGEDAFDPLPLTQAPDTLIWSPDSSSVLLHTGSQYFLVVAGAQHATLVPALKGITSIAWDTRLPGRLLGLRSSKDLVLYTLATQELQLIAKDIGVFAPTSRNIIAVTQGNALAWYSLNGSLVRTRELTNIKDVTRLLTTPGGNIALQYGDNSVAVITSNNELVPVGEHADLVGWSPDGMMLLVRRSTAELAIFNVDNKRSTYIPLRQLKSIIRLSHPIRNPQWFAGGTHVVFQVEDQIVLSEVDTRDHAIQFTVDSTNTGDAQVAVGENGNTLLYKKITDGTANLVQRLLVLPADQ